MKKLGSLLCVLICTMLLLPAVAGAVTIANKEEAQQALSGLTSTTVMNFADYWDSVDKTANDQITLEKCTDAVGQYSRVIRVDVLSTNSGSTSRQLLYRNLSGIQAGDQVLVRMVMRSVGNGEGKAAITLMAKGASSSANKSFTIPQQWTEIYIPLTAKDNATITTFRLHTKVQTLEIADFEVICYGGNVDLNSLPSGQYPVEQEAPPTMEGLTGGKTVTLINDRYTNVVQADAGERISYVAPQPVSAGNMALLALDLKAVSGCSKVTVSFCGVTKSYAVAVQWSRIYLPVQATTVLTGATVTVDAGSVYVGAATLENKGSATFEELSLQSGMWMLDDFADVALDPVESGVGAGKTVDMVISPDGEYIYSIGDGNFTVTRVSTQTVVSQLSGFGDTRQIALCAQGNAVIFTSRIYGAYIVDVSNPAQAAVISHYDTLEMATGIATYQDYAFICSRFYGVEVVDISDLSNPVHKCIIRNGGEVQSIEVVDGYLYGGLYNTNQVEIYDVKDPVHYKRVGVANLAGRGDGVAVAKFGDKTYLYAGTGHHSVAGLATSTPLSNLNYGDGNGLDIFDVTDPSNPVWLSTSRTDGRFYHTSCDYWGAQVSCDEATGKVYAYLVSTYNGVYVFDVTDPAAPIRVAHVAVQIPAGSEFYKKPSSSRAIIFQYDPALYTQSPAGSVACADGMLMYAGVDTDLHILAADYAHAHVEKPAQAQIQSNFAYYHFDDFKDLPGFASADPEGQTASVALYGDKVYVSGGDQGILIYSKDLQHLHKVVSLNGCSYDVFIQDGKLYSAEGTEGFAVYGLSDDGLTLTQQVRYKSGCVTMARPSATGKFVVIHSGATVGEIVDISGSKPVRKIRAVASSQMYHHNVVTNVADRYVAFWANSGSERWYDLGENDSLSTPVLLSNVPTAGFATRCAMTGGFTAYKNGQVLCTGNNGYYVYDPTEMTADAMKALKSTKPVDASGNTVNVTGKPSIYGNTLVMSDRLYGKLYILDIRDIAKPVLLRAFTTLPGNPDVATFSGDSIYIPLGYQGLIKLDLAGSGADMTEHYDADHCVCAGHAQGVQNHTCAPVAWSPWSNPKALPTAGNYYLTCDVEVSTQTTVTSRLNLCLHGHSVTAVGMDRIYYTSGQEIHVTDCMEQTNWGSMTGGTLSSAYDGNGGAIFQGKGSAFRLYLYAGNYIGGTAARGGVAHAAAGQIHIYGGQLQNGIASKMGGNLYINLTASLYIYDGTIKNGSAKSSTAGNIFLNVGSTMYMYGGQILGGSAKTDGGNIYASAGGAENDRPGAVIYMTGGTVADGTADRNGANIYLGGKSALNPWAELSISGGQVRNGDIVSNGSLRLGNGGVDAPVVMLNDTQVVLEADGAASLELTGNGVLYLNGHTLTGNVTGAGTLYVVDTSGDGYTMPSGRITGSVSCQLPRYFQAEGKRYLTVGDETGYTFHRFDLYLTHMSLAPAVTGVGYKAVFLGDDVVRGQLAQENAFGYKLWLDGVDKILTLGKGAQDFVSGAPVTLRLRNFDVINHGQTPVCAKVYLQLSDGTVVESSEYSYSLRSLMEIIAGNLDKLNQTQLQAVRDMVNEHINVMKNWALGELLAG